MPVQGQHPIVEAVVQARRHEPAHVLTGVVPGHGPDAPAAAGVAVQLAHARDPAHGLAALGVEPAALLEALEDGRAGLVAELLRIASAAPGVRS